MEKKRERWREKERDERGTERWREGVEKPLTAPLCCVGM